MARLSLIVDDREVRSFPLSSAVTTLGRATDNDVVINNIALSRRHAEVHRRGDRFEVVDKGSQNGVFVNQERIDGRRALVSGDRIQLGSYVFRFVDEPLRSRPKRQAPRTVPPLEVAPSEEPTPPPGDVGPPTPAPSMEEVLAPPVAVLTYNDLEVQRVPLEEDEYLVGRAKECDIQITERRLSRRHCLLFKDDDGRWMVRDLDSQNGTYVNRRRVRDAQLLESGDVLNFAEYAVVFLTEGSALDAEARSVELEVRPTSGIEKEQTEMPVAYQDALISPAASEPVVSEPPRSRRPRLRQAVAEEPVFESRRPTPARAKSEPRAPRVEAARERPTPPPKEQLEEPVRPTMRRPPAPFEAVDVPDPDGDHRPRPDPRLDPWYDQRSDEEDDDESSVLLERSRSTMSQVLSTMMVDKKELARNLEVARRRRRFSVRVSWNEDLLHEGALDQDVTVLGADDEADLQLRGRYVSGRHSLLVRVRDSLLLVRLGSSSVARVNGQPRLQAFLKDGDVVQIDETLVEITER